jgi:hypothetical protein
MTLHFWIALVFGVAALACAAIILIWYKTLRHDGQDHKVVVVASGLMIANIGVGTLLVNRAVSHTVGYDIYPVGLLVAGVVILIGKVTWVLGLCMDNPRCWPLRAFIAGSIAWVSFCIYWWELR